MIMLLSVALLATFSKLREHVPRPAGTPTCAQPGGPPGPGRGHARGDLMGLGGDRDRDSDLHDHGARAQAHSGWHLVTGSGGPRGTGRLPDLALEKLAVRPVTFLGCLLELSQVAAHWQSPGPGAGSQNLRHRRPGARQLAHATSSDASLVADYPAGTLTGWPPTRSHCPEQDPR